MLTDHRALMIQLISEHDVVLKLNVFNTANNSYIMKQYVFVLSVLKTSIFDAAVFMVISEYLKIKSMLSVSSHSHLEYMH